MGLIRRISEIRDEHITAHARPHLGEGERILQWVRARHPASGDEGFVYLTESSCVVYWSGNHAPPTVVAIDGIDAWGIDLHARGGPLLGLEADGTAAFAQVLVSTEGMALAATELFRRLAEMAPDRARPLGERELGTFVVPEELRVPKEKKTLAAHTKRIGVTAAGIVLVVAGIVLSLPLVPGPGIVVIIAGLAVLSTEYDWAKDAREWAKERFKDARKQIKKRRAPS